MSKLRNMQQKIKQLTNGRERPLAFILGVTIAGSIALAASNAATFSISNESEAGTITGNACASSDSTASGSGAIAFGTTCSATLTGLARIPWEGGPNYWKTSNGAQFAKADAAGWDDPNFFPITVFYGKADPAHVSKLKEAGINTYDPPEHDPSVLPLSNVTSQGLYAMPSIREYTTAELKNDTKAVGWFTTDECEMGYSDCQDSNNEAQRLAVQLGFVNQVKTKNDGRFSAANFGNGILRTYWGSDNTMQQYVRTVDVSSGDKYTYTSPSVGFEVGRSPD